MIARSRNLSQPLSILESMAGARAEYNAAQRSPYRRSRTGVGEAGNHADYHYRSEADYLRMMELARDFMRNDIVIPQGVRRLVDNVLQDGLRLDPQTGNEEANARLAERWSEWSGDPEACDLAGEHNFHQLERFALMHTVVDGDIVFLPLASGQLEAIEAHRIRTPSNTKRNVVHGFLLDDHRKPLEIWVTREDVGLSASVSRVGAMRQIPYRDAAGAKQVFHVRRGDRITQTRGVTAFAPIVDTAGMHDDIQFAKLVQQQVVSCIAVIRERTAVFGLTGGGDQTGARTTETQADGSERITDALAPGMEWKGLPGETIKGFSPAVPNAEFFQHATLLLTFIAVNLGIPVAVLLLDPSNTNFSGWRGAMDQARVGFREIQNWLAARLHRPVYEWKVRQWLAVDPLLRSLAKQPDCDIFCHRWNPPTWAYIEPLKDAQADTIQQLSNLNSDRRLQAQRGRDWDELSTEIVDDRAKLIRKAILAAQLLNSEFASAGIEVDYRELLQPAGAPALIAMLKAQAQAEAQQAAPEQTAQTQEAA